MTRTLFKSFQNHEKARKLLKLLQSRLSNQNIDASGWTIMEVCGTHTVAVGKQGLRPLMEPIKLVSGPGCPVCVISEAELAAVVRMMKANPSVKLLTYGDMIEVPTSEGSLAQLPGQSQRVIPVYSAMDALNHALNRPDESHVFLAIGFETTIPATAVLLNAMRDQKMKNLSVLLLHKLLMPALEVLLRSTELNLDGLLLPGHVAVVTGREKFQRVFEQAGGNIPGVISGFEAVDILFALNKIIEGNSGEVYNCYTRAVSEKGNPTALKLADEVFEPVDVYWRGLGKIHQSGLKLQPEYLKYDAWQAWALDKFYHEENEVKARASECACGEIIMGKTLPQNCPVFARACTPEHPMGPCMVSAEGSCRAYYKYDRA